MIDMTAACAGTAGLLARVRDDQLGAATPCSGMNLDALIAHVGGLALAFDAAARKEFGPLTDTPPETVAAMATLGQRIARAARVSGLHADGNNIAINDGKAAFQSVFHIHLHVVPRRSGDKLSFAKGMLVRRDADREESGRLLRAALAQLDEAAQD